MIPFFGILLARYRVVIDKRKRAQVKIGAVNQKTFDPAEKKPELKEV
jgi:hypothetical protein